MFVNKVFRFSVSRCPAHCRTVRSTSATARSVTRFSRSRSTTCSGACGPATVQIARNNGLTEEEIAEVVYHSTGYAGFPAGNTACKLAREVFDAKS